jgi:zinc protease
VVLFPDPTKSNITVNVTYMVGSRHEYYGETGLAHLLEHLMFKGSKNHPQIPKELTDHGTRPNGSTWFDRTNYFETFSATDENLKWALELESDRMLNAFISMKDLESEFTVVRNEFEMGENSPQSVLEERTFSTAYLWHNYGKSTIGARSDIEHVPIDRLQAFYQHFYQPDNAILIVAGKIDEAKTLALIQSLFGPLPKPTRKLRGTYTVEPVQDGERAVTLRRNGDVQAVFVFHHIPAASDPEYIAVDVASDILGDQPSGRLYKALIEPKKAVEVFSRTYSMKEPGAMLAGAIVRTESPLPDAKTALIQVFDEIKTKPFTDEEVERVRTAGLKQIDLMMNNSERVALQLSEYQAVGDWRMLFIQRDRLKAVKRADVQKAAEKYFISSNRTVGEFLPDKNPIRAEVPTPPDVMALVKDYKGTQEVSQGEAFDASPANIDKRTIRTELPGGLKLSLLSKKTRGEQVTAVVTLRFGDENTLKDRSFAAAMAGQMLMRGTAKHTRQQIKDEFDKMKAQVSVSGGNGSASATIRTTKPNLQKALALVAELLRESTFPEKEFEELKQQTLAGFEEAKSDPQSIAIREVQRHLGPYPKGDVRYTPTIEEAIEGVKGLTLEQVKAYWQSFYGASTGEVTVIGDFDPEMMPKQLGDLFSDWKSPKKFARIENNYKPIPAEAKAVDTPDKANAMWVAGFPVQMTDTDPEFPALVMGNYILGGSGLNSRLFARIRGKEGLSYGVGSQLSIPAIDNGGAFLAYAICAPENAPKVEASFKDEMAKVLANGYTADEVEAAKKSWLQARQVSRANDSELAGRLGTQRFYGRTMAFDSELEAKMLKLTPAEIQAAMKKYFDPSKISFYRAGDFVKKNVVF